MVRGGHSSVIEVSCVRRVPTQALRERLSDEEKTLRHDIECAEEEVAAMVRRFAEMDEDTREVRAQARAPHTHGMAAGS
jgi:Holliday junction resolvasome RuvABC endonuclease subunit